MALTVPESVNAANLTGSYTLNKTVSDSTDSVLQFQGVSWLLRKTISMMSVTVHLKQWTDEDGVTILNTESESAGGMRKSDIRKLDWTDNETNDTLFGKISVKMRVIKFGELPDDLDPWLKEDWDDEVVNGSVLQSATTSLQNGWKAAQIVGYGLKDGVRRQMRKVVVTKGSEQRKVTIFYDWVGPLEV